MHPVRTPWNNLPDAIIDRKLAEATGHLLYKKAKSGDVKSAYGLAKELVTDNAITQLRKLIGSNKPILVPVHALEPVGTNMIPMATAEIISESLGLWIETSIVQAIKVSRTGADGWHRLANSPYFSGDFSSGNTAIMIDDTLTQGGTFASLKGHIESQGGQVLAAYGLTGKQYSRQLTISDQTLCSLRKEYEEIEQWWSQTFGYDFSKLTEWEARYIINSRKAPHDIRDRIIKAKQV